MGSLKEYYYRKNSLLNTIFLVFISISLFVALWLAHNLTEKFVENVIGYFQLPLGVATNFKIDGRDFVIPMEPWRLRNLGSIGERAQGVQPPNCHWNDCRLGRVTRAPASTTNHPEIGRG